MARYGFDYYDESYYGNNNPLKLSALPFTATPGAIIPVGSSSSYSNYGTITLNWTVPSGLWANLVVVRNVYGFPVNPYDGIQVYSAYNDGRALPTFIDTGLTEGAFYYYAIWIFNTLQYTWTNAGNVIGLSVKDFGNSDKMYSYLPDIYKITEPYTPTADWDNPLLQQFLNNFAFQLDWDQTLAESLINRYDPTSVSGQLIPAMLNQFGQTYESAIGLQQNRILLRDAITLTKQRGSMDGLTGFLEDFTGWAIPNPTPQYTFALNSNNEIVPVAPTTSAAPNPSLDGLYYGINLMLDYNDSSFEESTGHWNSADGTADFDQLGSLLISSVSITSNVATLNFKVPSVTYTVTSASITNNVATITTSFNHNLTVGQDITVSNVGALYNGNQSITSVTSNTISFASSTVSAAVTSVTGTVIGFVHQYDVGNWITVTNLPYPILNTATSPVTPVQITVKTATSISFALTTSNLALSTGYNASLGVYGNINAYPTPASFDANGILNGSTSTLWPNKTTGILGAYNLSASQQNIDLYCGDAAPVTQGIPVTAGTYYTWSFYAAMGYSGTARTVTPIIKWYTRTGTYISSSTGTGVLDNVVTFSSSSRPFVTTVAPANAYYATPGFSVASVGGSATNEHHYFDAGQFEATPTSLSPSTSGNVATVTAASASGSVITYTANNKFSPNQTVSISGLNGSVAITAIAASSGVGTYSTASTTGLSAGQSIVISGATSASYNGTYTIGTVTSNTNFTVTYAGNITAATGAAGTVTYTCSNQFYVGQVVTITGLTTTTGSSLNLPSQTITALVGTPGAYTGFKISNATVGTATGTQTGKATPVGTTSTATGTYTSALNLSGALVASATTTSFTVASTVTDRAVSGASGSAAFAGQLFDEARNLHITFRANRINELVNPNFATTSNWYPTSATLGTGTTLPSPTGTIYSIASTSITSGSPTSTVTVTLTEPHTIQNGNSVYITSVSGTGVTATNYNGTRTPVVPVIPSNSTTYTQFTYTITGTVSQASLPTSGSVYVSSNSLQVTATGANAALASWDGSTNSQQTPIYYPNNSYTFSIYAQAGTATETLTPSISWYDSTHALISSSSGTAVSAPVGSWVRPYVTATAPATAAYAIVKVNWTTTTGNVISFDQALFENSGVLQAYFDGSGGPGLATDFSWESGNINSGRSHFYKNYYNVKARLAQGVIQSALVAGQTAVVYLSQPQT